jgi:hypothetical protein
MNKGRNTWLNFILRYPVHYTTSEVFEVAKVGQQRSTLRFGPFHGPRWRSSSERKLTPEGWPPEHNSTDLGYREFTRDQVPTSEVYLPVCNRTRCAEHVELLLERVIGGLGDWVRSLRSGTRSNPSWHARTSPPTRWGHVPYAGDSWRRHGGQRWENRERVCLRKM